MKRCIAHLVLACMPGMYYAQCCAGCSPIGGNTNQGTLPKYMLQINSYFKRGYSAGYMQSDHPSDFQFVKNANNDYIGLQLGYGVTSRFTAEAEAGYYLNRTQNYAIANYRYQLNGYGGSSITLGGKYSVLKDTVHDVEVTFGAGLKMPWSVQPQIINGVQLTEDVQPSSGAYGLVLRTFVFKAFDSSDVKIFLMNTININGTSQRNYREGNTYITSFFVSKTFLRNWTAIGQVRNEVRDFCYSEGKKVASSGGYRFIFVPQINYRFRKRYNISALYEIPIYQNYNGIQLHDLYAFSINLNIRLGLSKKANAACERPAAPAQERSKTL